MKFGETSLPEAGVIGNGRLVAVGELDKVADPVGWLRGSCRPVWRDRGCSRFGERVFR